MRGSVEHLIFSVLPERVQTYLREAIFILPEKVQTLIMQKSWGNDIVSISFVVEFD